MKLVAYTFQNKYQLSLLLKDYVEETEGNCIGSPSTAIDIMLENDRHIYLLYKDTEAIGFIVMYVNDQYGLVEPTIVNEYMYLKPNHRTSVASKYMLLQTLDYCSKLKLDLIGYTYNDSSNIHNVKKLNGKEIGTIFKLSLDTINNKLNKLRKIK